MGGQECSLLGIIYGLWWFVILLIVWYIAFFAAWLYVLCLPFSRCIEPIKGLCDALLKFIQLSYTMADNMVSMKPIG
jgi:hypothetical protein